ncbi:hypothetical protein RF11_12271 [Thelohanellus kitauei]|uniref:Uncharacterized protein n=1 Tax=Thelohanellus kitauei TaxID=669202 RepID=A0A0C2IUE9_THEKT|nr:hypothetical protein RF11_12271 [Thelohanellus kitauei]
MEQDMPMFLDLIDLTIFVGCVFLGDLRYIDLMEILNLVSSMNMILDLSMLIRRGNFRRPVFPNVHEVYFERVQRDRAVLITKVEDIIVLLLIQFFLRPPFFLFSFLPSSC